MMLEGVNTTVIQYLAIGGSLGLIIFILELIRKKKVKEEYSLLWLFVSLVFLGVSIYRDGLDKISRMIGVAYPPVAFLLILIMGIFFILIQYSIIISKHAEINKELIQEIGFLKQKIEKLQKNKHD